MPETGWVIRWERWCWRDSADNLPRPAERFGLRVSEQRLTLPELEVIRVLGTGEADPTSRQAW